MTAAAAARHVVSQAATLEHSCNSHLTDPEDPQVAPLIMQATPQSSMASDFSLSTSALAIVFAGWYGASMLTGASTKWLTKMDQKPMFITLMQFITATVLSRIVCAARGTYKPLSLSQYAQFAPVCASYTLGFLALNCALAQGNVSFTETLRACEPLFSLLFVKLFLPQEKITTQMYLAVLPIVIGIALSSMSEPTFSMAVFIFASASNVCFASRSLFVKRLKASDPTFKELDPAAMIHHQHLLAIPVLILVVTLSNSWPTVLPSATTMLLNGTCFYSYNQLSLVVLYAVSMATHAIGNAFRRVATIVFAILVFGNLPDVTGVLGITMAISGVAMYSRASAMR